MHSKYVGHFTEIIWQSKTKWPLLKILVGLHFDEHFVRTHAIAQCTFRGKYSEESYFKMSEKYAVITITCVAIL